MEWLYLVFDGLGEGECDYVYFVYFYYFELEDLVSFIVVINYGIYVMVVIGRDNFVGI